MISSLSSVFHSSLNGGSAHMASGARNELVENAISDQAEELAAKSTEAHGPRTKRRQQAQPSKQDSATDVSREGPAKPPRRKRSTKATKTQQAPPTPIPTGKSAAKIPGSAEEIIAPQVTDNASATTIGAAGADFVADPEPIAQGGGYLCTFTLSHPGLVGLNKLAIFLNDLQDAGSITGWQAKGWENAATKVRTLIGFASHADAVTAIKRAH